MPVVAVVDGVKIVFYANEHPPAHFHAVIAEHRAVVDIVGVKINCGIVAGGEARQSPYLGRLPQGRPVGAFRGRPRA
jgi:Domain of unknown function (DUF4160)